MNKRKSCACVIPNVSEESQHLNGRKAVFVVQKSNNLSQNIENYRML